MPSRKLTITIAAGFAFAIAGSAVLAEGFGPRPEGAAYGSEISEADLALWDIDIQTPTGKGLPAGEGTVAQGKEIFQAKCVACHGEDAAGGSMYGSMVGGIGSMTERPRKLTPGSMYPYAPIFFDYVRRSMPMDSPMSLTDEEVYSLAAYIYHLNGLVPEDVTMNAETMSAIEMPNKDAFIPDDRPDASAERCMSDCKPIGTVADGQKS